MMTLMKIIEEDKTTDEMVDAKQTTTPEKRFPMFPTQPTPRRLIKLDLEAQT